jgi:DMSO reductase anchor subunit
MPCLRRSGFAQASETLYSEKTASMIDPFAKPLPRSAYFRLLEHQKKTKLTSYQPDFPLVLFISFSRVAAGLSLVSVFFPPSPVWSGVSLGCMILATLASIAHLSAPQRFLTMIINNRSYLVWEIRLAGALTTFLGFQFLASLGWFQAYGPYFLWVTFVLSILFLFSTGWAYRFETHPAWRTSILPLYYLASALIVGLGLRSIQYPFASVPFFFAAFLLAKGLLLTLYRNHLDMTSPTSLKKIVVDRERGIFLAFLWTDLLLPALLIFFMFFRGDSVIFHCLLTTSSLVGIFLERILFFWVERPVFFLSFTANPELNAKYPYWIRG